MSFFKIDGGRPLSGRLTVQGAKNSVLPILCACILAPGRSVIENCPQLADVDATAEILRQLGCRIQRSGPALAVDAADVRRGAIPAGLAHRMRSSIIFLGALLARLGEAELAYPGGCELGPRPVDLHLAALRAMGAEICEAGGVLRARAPDGLRGCEIDLAFPSVGATENVMLAACGAEGITVIRGAAREPEIEDLARFLNAMGACVTGAGTDMVKISAPACGCRPARHRAISDRIAAATWLSCCAAAGGEVTLDGAEPGHLTAVLQTLRDAGCRIGTERDSIMLTSDGLRGVPLIRTEPYPGFPTDAQAPVMAALCAARGTTVFEETIFQNRYRHAEGLACMGADIRISGRRAAVRGRALHGADVCSTDLRGGAALVTAALCARGESRVGGLAHIDRGYEHMERELRLLGARIERRE